MLTRLLNLLRARRLDRELDEELNHHVDALEAEHRARGLSPDAARAAALRDMGGVEQAREAYRDRRGLPLLETLWRDVRFGCRSLRRTPGVTAAVTATLAIGIGANTAIFAIVDGVLLKPLPYPDAGTLVSIAHRSAGTDEEIPSAPYLYFTYRDESRTLAAVGVWKAGPATITGLDRPEQVQALLVTKEVLPLLGVAPAIGREFSAAEDAPGGPARAILTYGYWQRRFGGDPSVVGRRIVVDGSARDVIGVMPRSFRFLDRPVDIIYPFQLDARQVTLGRYTFPSIARLRPGVSIEAAETELARLVPIAIERFPPPAGYTRAQFARNPLTPHLRLLKDEIVGDVGRMLWVLAGALALVLLIAGANVANLLLVRTGGRQQELAVRAALGASRRRLATELLSESVLLGLLGGLAGLAVAYAAVRIVLTIGPANLPRADAIAIDAPVLLYTVGISIAAGLLFGLLPVARYVTPRLTASVGAGPRTVTDNRERRRARGALVVAQVALAIVLLVCSGLMIRTFQALSHVRPGFESPDDVQLAYVNVNLSDPETTTRAQQAIVDRLDAVPGVASAAFADIAPLGANNSGNDTVLIVDGRIYREGEPRPLRRFEFISPRLFTTLGTPLVAGRDFTWSDLYDHRMVAVVSETLARAEWGGPALALGKRVRASPADPWREVVGVAGDIHDDGMNQAPPPTVYFPALLASFWGAPKISFGSATMIVRTSRAGSESFLRELQQAVWSVNPDLAVSDVHTLGEAYRKSLARTSFTLTLLLLAGGMGLALGFIGIYGVIAYGVSQRTREIGIRLALGAEDGELKRMFVGHGVALAAAGVVAGAIAAGAATRVMSTLLFGVGRLDPVTYVAVILLVLLVAILASYLPARRAVRGSPVDALRTV